MADTALVVKGSILDVANGEDESMALMDARLILVCDRSSSMETSDVDGKARYKVEDEVVVSLQGKYPGQIALVPFSDIAYLALDGRLPFPDGSTNLVYALNMIEPVVQLGVRACIVSDGYPDSPEECLQMAKRMHGHIDCIFIGKPDSDGDKFMKRLADAVGGTHQSNDATKELEGMVEKLLLTDGK